MAFGVRARVNLRRGGHVLGFLFCPRIGLYPYRISLQKRYRAVNLHTRGGPRSDGSPFLMTALIKRFKNFSTLTPRGAARSAGAERSAGARARPMPLDQAFVMKTTFSRHTGGGGVYGTIPQWKPKPDIVPPPANCGGFTYGGAGRMWEPLPLPSSIIPKETTEWRNYRHLGMNAPLAFSAPVIIHKDLMRSISP